MTQKHTVMLIIMDGFGCRDEKKITPWPWLI